MALSKINQLINWFNSQDDGNEFTIPMMMDRLNGFQRSQIYRFTQFLRSMGTVEREMRDGMRCHTYIKIESLPVDAYFQYVADLRDEAIARAKKKDAQERAKTKGLTVELSSIPCESVDIPDDPIILSRRELENVFHQIGEKMAALKRENAELKKVRVAKYDITKMMPETIRTVIRLDN
jgi:hypothetical protein